MRQLSLTISFILIFSILNSQSFDSLYFFYNHHDYFETIKIGEKLKENNHEIPSVFFITGMSYIQLNKLKKAEQNIQKAYFLDSLNKDYINAYAKIKTKTGLPKQAVSLYTKTLKIDSLNYNALNNLSKLYLSLNKYKSALNIYKILSLQDSLNPYYYRKIAYSYLKLNDAKSCLNYYKKAYNIDSTDVTSIKAVSITFYKMKRYNDAIDFCNKGIAIDSLYSDFYRIKANSNFKKNHLYRAIPDYKKVIQLGDSSYNVVKRLGMSLCEIKEFEDALKYNLAAYKADTSSYSNTSYLSKNYLGLEENEKCIEFADKTVKRLSFSKRITSDILDNKAIAYLNMEKYKNALNMYDQKYSIFRTRYVTDNFNIALLNDKLDHKKTALKYYKLVIEYKNRNKIPDRKNSIYDYSKQRIIRIKEDLFFEGN